MYVWMYVYMYVCMVYGYLNRIMNTKSIVRFLVCMYVCMYACMVYGYLNRLSIYTLKCNYEYQKYRKGNKCGQRVSDFTSEKK